MRSSCYIKPSICFDFQLLFQFLQTARLLIKIAAHISQAIAHVHIALLGKTQRLTRFTKISVCSLSAINLSVCNLSKPKPCRRASCEEIVGT